MKQSILFLILAFMPTYVAANPACIALGDTIESVIFEEEAKQPTEKPRVLPVAATSGVGSTLETLNALQVLTLTPGVESGQGVRSENIMKALICKESADNVGDPLSVAASPLRMELGETPLRYHLGAVLGNWAIFSGTAVISGALAKRFGMEHVGFPGVTSIPALFLLPATTESTVKLIAQGTRGETAAGAVSAIAQTAGVAMIGILMHPRFFHATWQNGWRDAKNFEGFVGKTGAIYEGLREQRNWFVTIDVGTSIASGFLAGLQGSVNNCGAMLIANAAVYSGYALALIVLKPYENKYEQYFFSGVAAAQAMALTTQAIVHASASEETADSVRPAAQSVVLATEILLSMKSAYDVIRRVFTQTKNLFNFFKNKPAPETTTNLESLSTPLASTTDDVADVDSILGIEALESAPFTAEELAKIEAAVSGQEPPDLPPAGSEILDALEKLSRTPDSTASKTDRSVTPSDESPTPVVDSVKEAVGTAVTLASEAGNALLNALRGAATRQERQDL